MKYGLFTISTFDLIPLCRHITTYWCKEDDNTVEMVQCSVSNTISYHKSVRKFSIGQYSSRAKINKQSSVFKVLKYIKLIYYLTRFQFKYRSSVLYAIDLPTLNIFFLCRIFFFFNKNKIIYHQFEIVIPDQLTIYGKINLFLFKILREGLGLFVCPEINRLEYFCAISKFSKDRTFLLPNTTIVSAKDNIPHRDDEIITIAHIGIAGKDHYVSQFIEVIKELKLDKQFRILFIGYQSTKVGEILNSAALPNLELIEDIPHQQLQEYYKQIDIGIILYKDLGLNFKYCAPNKLYEYWSSGIFVLAHPLDGLLPLFTDKNLGELCNMDKKEEFTGAVSSAINNFSWQNRSKIMEIFNSRYSILNYLSAFSKKLADTP